MISLYECTLVHVELLFFKENVSVSFLIGFNENFHFHFEEPYKNISK